LGKYHYSHHVGFIVDIIPIIIIIVIVIVADESRVPNSTAVLLAINNSCVGIPSPRLSCFGRDEGRGSSGFHQHGDAVGSTCFQIVWFWFSFQFWFEFEF